MLKIAHVWFQVSMHSSALLSEVTIELLYKLLSSLLAIALIRRCYSPQRILKISKLAKRKHRSTYPFAVPGHLKFTTIRKFLVHLGVSVGISTRFVENFWFNKLIRKISPFTPNISASTLEQSTLPQLSAEASEICY